jgi:hypothetical protein
MQIENAKPGTRVVHEPENNATFWRGEIQDHGSVPIGAGLVLVKWDDSAAATLIPVADLETEQ